MGKKSAKKKTTSKSENMAHETKTVSFSKNTNDDSLIPFIIQALFVFFLSAILYSNTVNHDYAVDDTLVITKNKLTQKGFKGIPEIMTTDAFYGFFGDGYKLVAGGRYRPLSIVTFAIEEEFFDGNPTVSHFINVLLYSFSVLLLFYVLSSFLNSWPKKPLDLTIPFLATLLFAAHPLHTEVVANIKGRDEVMGLLGALGMLLLVWKYVETKKLLYLVSGLFVYILALLSKENAITYLAVVPLSLFFFSNAKLKDYLITIIPLTLVAGIYVYMRQTFTTAGFEESNEILNNPFVHANLAERLATVAFTFGEYFKLLIFPHPLTHDYYYNQVPILSWSNPKAIIPALITLAILVYGLIKLKSKSLISFGILYFFITISVVSNVLFSVGIAMNERFVYLSSIGFCIVLAALIKNADTFANKTSKLPVAAIITFVFLTGFSVKTITRNSDWENDFTLFEADYYNSPNSAKIKNAYGGELTAQADKVKGTPLEKEYLRTAEKVLTEALEIYPSYKNANLILGNVKWKLHKDSKSAIQLYERTLQMHPTYYEGNFNMACVLLEEDRSREAIPHFKQAVRSKPGSMEAWYNLGESYYKLNMGDSAVYFYKQALQRQPNNGLIYYKIGLTYGKVLQQLDESINWLKQATQKNSGNVSFYEDLGVAYGFKGDYKNAIATFEKGLKLQPNNKQLIRNIGVTYQQMGQEEKAREYFQRIGM